MPIKTITKTILFTLFSLSLLISCSDSGSDGSGNNNDPSKLDQTEFSAGEDQFRYTIDNDFTQTATGVDGTGVTTYSSDNESVATVNSSGEVQILSIGETIITASNTGDDYFNPASDSYTLTVLEPAFITTWEIENPGDSITIPKYPYGSFNYNYSIDWGDGNTDSDDKISPNISHTYDTAGIYTVKITGTFPAIWFAGIDGSENIRTIEQWGNGKWRHMALAYEKCTNLTCNAIDAPDLSIVTDINSMFKQASSFTGDLSKWDVSNITNMSNMFCDAFSFNGNLNNWDVSQVTNMNRMFSTASSFNGNISDWDVGNVTSMRSMFQNATSFNGNINGWNVCKVTIMDNMFSGASSFNGDIGGWNVGKVTNMSYMFYNAVNFSGHDLNGWDVSKVTDYSEFGTGWGPGNTEPQWPE